jgi:hypothetical protein
MKYEVCNRCQAKRYPESPKKMSDGKHLWGWGCDKEVGLITVESPIPVACLYPNEHTKE